MATTASPHHVRIQSAFEGFWPDRIPICEQAFASSVASEILGRPVWTGSTDVHYAEACAYLAGDQAHHEFLDRLLADTVALARHFDFDVLHLPWRHTVRPTRRVDEYRILYGDPEGSDWRIYNYDPESRTYGLSQSARGPMAVEEVVQTIRTQFRQLDRGDSGQMDELRARAQREYGNEFVVAGSGGMAVPMEPGWLEATVVDPKLVGEYIDLQIDRVLASILAQYEHGIKLINGGGDFAFNDGPVYSPEFFRQVMLPRWKRVFEFCRDLGVYYVMRSDGDLWPVADDLFGDGQPHAYYEVDYDAGMRFDRLRARFPELVLIGNVSCDLLRRGTPDQVARRTRECIEAAGPRVVAASSNSIMHGTPPANVEALYEAAKGYRPSRNGNSAAVWV
ncbi:MAG: hypothetical protein GXY33_15680 [Phycisphaerae bacterium]|nr:hypothetical protein [Phycisphaerae bacterium]